VTAVRGIPFSAAPLDGVVTAGQPSAAQLAELAANGTRTVVDLRTQGEPRGYDEPAVARDAGLAYHNIPVGPGPITDAQFDAVRAHLREAARRPLLLHCATANRVGAMLIPYLVLDEQRTPEEALRIASSVGLRSGDLARAAFSYVERNAAG
jgi:uncharacterized protein (TIGR01244 family)